jgi:hypothetical protein
MSVNLLFGSGNIEAQVRRMVEEGEDHHNDGRGTGKVLGSLVLLCHYCPPVFGQIPVNA